MKRLSLSIIAAATLILLACGGDEPSPPPPPLPEPTQPTSPTPDVQETVEAGVQATIAAQVAPTTTPEPTPAPPTSTPEPTPVPPTSTPEPVPTPPPLPEPTPPPPTSTPEPEPTPVPPTSTPEPEPTPVPPTSTPEPTPAPPTNTPAPTSTPEPTPTETPVPVGMSWGRPFPIGEAHPLQNAAGLTLRVREGRVYWGQEAWEIIDDEDPLNDPPPRGLEYLLIDIQVRNGDNGTSAYDAAARLTVEGEPPNSNVYRWGGANHCGEIPQTVIKSDFALQRHSDEYGRRGNICFVVPRAGSGRLVLVDSGGPGAPAEDRRYFSLRR